MSKQELIEKAVLKLNGEFPQGDEGDDWLYQFSSGRYVAGASGGVNPHVICTREEFNAAADRMRGKPDWKDAPEWAQWLGQCFSGNWEWYQKKPSADNDCFDHGTGRGCQSGARGKVIGDWRSTLEQRPEQKVEQAPAKPWFEAGELPKAGTKCLCYFDDGRECWHECVVIGSIDEEIKNGYLAVSLIGEHERKLIWANDFKPIRTDKEKAIEFALGKINNGMNRHAAPYIIEQLYDAGLLRLPDNKKPD